MNVKEIGNKIGRAIMYILIAFFFLLGILSLVIKAWELISVLQGSAVVGLIGLGIIIFVALGFFYTVGEILVEYLEKSWARFIKRNK